MFRLVLMCLFFFKQKTAYEMRISDWSSDVCSSDLQLVLNVNRATRSGHFSSGDVEWELDPVSEEKIMPDFNFSAEELLWYISCWMAILSRPYAEVAELRSEEHTSELQSLMRISYAVFCLKKKIIRCRLQQPAMNNIQAHKTQQHIASTANIKTSSN